MMECSDEDVTLIIKRLPGITTDCCPECENYDPCAACQDITKRDLAILAELRKAQGGAEEEEEEETAKVKAIEEQPKNKKAEDKQAEDKQAKVERAKGKQAKGELTKREQAKDEKAKGEQTKGEQAKDEKAKGEQTKGEQAKDEQGKEGNGNIKPEHKKSKGQRIPDTEKSARVGETNVVSKSGRNQKESSHDDADAVATVAAVAVRPRKRTCRKKIEKYPFYTDRFSLSACLPLPPPFPPRQLHPLADDDEEIECPEPKKRRPCRNKPGKKVIRETEIKIEATFHEETKTEYEDIKAQNFEEDEEENLDQDIEENEEEEKEEEDEEEKEEVEDEEEKEVEEKEEEKEQETEEEEKEEVEEEDEKKENNGVLKEDIKEEPKVLIYEEEPIKVKQPVLRQRKPCMRRDPGRCKKKVSDISISLLPPCIPPLQRALPPTCPRNIPEMERQTFLEKEAKRMKRERCKYRGNRTRTKLELL